MPMSLLLAKQNSIFERHSESHRCKRYTSQWRRVPGDTRLDLFLEIYSTYNGDVKPRKEPRLSSE